ncbi:myosin-4-like [Euwallacea similis]|uniref:myosin-4-like n=1 Tax=Euwallacea similis TaxID=1736056 RepID=UPI00344FDE7F
MFFISTVLFPQQAVLVNTAWIAATLGISRIKRKDIENCDIQKLCRQILHFMNNESQDPRKKFSLRLSTTLVEGVVLVLHQKPIYLRRNIQDLLMNFSKKKIKTLAKSARLRNEEEESWSYPEIVEKKKKKKDAKPIDIDYLLSTTLQRIQPDLNQEPPVQADLRDITLREYESEPRRAQELSSIYDDFGPMEFPHGTTTKPSIQLAQEMATISQLPTLRSPKVHQATAAEVVEPLTVAEPLESMPPPQEVAFQEQIPEITLLPTSLVPTVAGLDQPDEVVPEQRHVMAKKIKTNAELWHVNTKRKNKFVAINKKSLDIFEKAEDYLTLINKIDRLPDFVFLDHFVTHPEELELDEPRAQENRSTTSRVGSTNLASNPATLSLEVQSIGELPSIPQKRSIEQDNTVTFSMPLLANEFAFATPSKRPKVVTVEEVRGALDVEASNESETLKEHTDSSVPVEEIRRTLEQELIGESKKPEEQPYVYASALSKSPRNLEFGIQWVSRIMDVLAIHPKLKAIELCSALNENPTKLNMARIFAAVLTLAKHQHVCLFPKENSIELEFIENGPVQFNSLLW